MTIIYHSVSNVWQYISQYRDICVLRVFVYTLKSTPLLPPGFIYKSVTAFWLIIKKHPQIGTDKDTSSVVGKK